MEIPRTGFWKEATITVKLDGVTRRCKVADHTDSRFPTYRLFGVMLMTAHGGKLHRGYVEFEAREDPEHVYTIKDVQTIGYHGMRGNGRGTPSRFRHIGFDRPVEEARA